MLTYNIHSIIRIHIIYNLQYCDGIIIIIVTALSPRLSVLCFQDRSRQLEVEAA